MNRGETIGIVPALRASDGGVYQYSLAVLDALADAEGSWLLLTDVADHPAVIAARRRGWRVEPLERRRSFARARAGAVRARLRGNRRGTVGAAATPVPPGPDPDTVYERPDIDRRLRRLGAELLLYPVPRSVAFEARVPYVFTVHDLQHRLQPHFPEVSAGAQWRKREYVFKNGVRYATLVVVDSEVGKEDVLACYGELGVDEGRVKVLPFVPPPYVGDTIDPHDRGRIPPLYGVPPRFLFYPAQFWPHKNHVRIVRALGQLRKRGADVPAIVFCGSHEGELREQTFAEVVATARDVGVTDRVHYVGYVPEEHMPMLYASAVALVMPTFFGPTNIPILEAWSVGCPVLTSSIRGVREQAADAALLVDPESVEELADGMGALWDDDALRARLAARGREHLASYGPAEFRQRLRAIVAEARQRLGEGDVPPRP